MRNIRPRNERVTGRKARGLQTEEIACKCQIFLSLLSGEGNGNPLSTLAWKISWMKEPGRLQPMGLLRVGHDSATSLSLFTFRHWRRKWRATPVFLPGESQGWGSLVGCRLWGYTESDTTEATQQQQQQLLNSLCRNQKARTAILIPENFKAEIVSRVQR